MPGHPVTRTHQPQNKPFQSGVALKSQNSESFEDAIVDSFQATRKVLCGLLLGSALFIGSSPSPVQAIDPTSLKQYTITPGAGIDPAQLKKFTEVQETLDAADIEYTMLKSGTSYREFREGEEPLYSLVGAANFSR